MTIDTDNTMSVSRSDKRLSLNLTFICLDMTMFGFNLGKFRTNLTIFTQFVVVEEREREEKVEGEDYYGYVGYTNGY